MNRQLDLFNQGPVARATRQVRKASHATFCVTTEYKATLAMRVPESLPAEPYGAGLGLCNARESVQ
jgi:hypothetical protein